MDIKESEIKILSASLVSPKTVIATIEFTNEDFAKVIKDMRETETFNVLTPSRFIQFIDYLHAAEKKLTERIRRHYAETTENPRYMEGIREKT